MESVTLSPLTADETKEVPVGAFHPILYHFKIHNVNQSDRSPSRAESGHLVRSRSRPALPFSHVLGYELDQLQFIRLCYKGNPHRLFELRRYIFPSDKLIKIRVGHNLLRSIPFEEQIVLSTFGGEVFAILESSHVFAGMYAYNPRTQHEGRAKINMESGRISPLTPDEIREVPVGPNRPISAHFIVDLVKQSPPYH